MDEKPRHTIYDEKSYDEDNYDNYDERDERDATHLLSL
jgi:hypothetical protein